MSLLTIIQKGEALAVLFEHKMQDAATQALPITSKILAALASPEALVVESLIPNGVVWGADAILAINTALPAIKIIAGIGDVNSTNGLLQRLGSELTSIIHGGKHPFTFYVQEFEYVCFGTNVLPTAA